MTDMGNGKYQLDVRQVVGGGLLIGIGGVIVLAGVALTGAALLGAARSRLRHADNPSAEFARRNSRRLAHAGRAAAGAWRYGDDQ